MGRKQRPVALECRDLDYEYDHHRGDFGLAGATLELRAGRGVALFGLNGAGKSTLSKVLAKPDLPGAAACDWRPTGGRVRARHRDGGGALANPHEGVASAAALFAVVGAALVALALGEKEVPADAFIDRGTVVFLVSLVAIFKVSVSFLRKDADARYRARVVYCSTEHDLARHATSDEDGLTEAICGPLRGCLDGDERAALCERLLDWAGFARTVEDGAPAGAAAWARDPGLTCGALSGGQRHLVYFLRCVAPCFCPADRERWAAWCLWQRRSPPPVDVLVLDEAFNCLDATVRPRCLRLALAAKEEHGVALLVVAQDLHELAVLCDEAVCVANGRLVERGPLRTMFAPSPKHEKDTRVYLDAYWGLERDMKKAAGREDLPETALAAAVGAELGRTVASLPPLRRWGPPWEAARLDRGGAVAIDGLESQRRFNGKKARVVETVGSGADTRVKVRLADGQVLAVRRCHLGPVKHD